MLRLVALPAFALVFAFFSSVALGQTQFAELGKQLPADTDDSTAVAVGDVDGDGDLDLVFGNGGLYGAGQNRLYLNDGKGKFTDATASRMPTDTDSTWAVALGDVDGDRDLDLVCGNAGKRNRLYLNDGKGTFIDATASRLPNDLDVTQAVALGDVDSDGDLDLVFGNGIYDTERSVLYPEQNRLYLNDGKGTFTDATASRLPTNSDSTQAVALGDVDRDGDLDLVFGNYLQNRLYLNDGKGTFNDATASRMPKDTDYPFAVALGDVDRDGDLDLVFGNYWGQNRLYLNDGKGKFIDATASGLPKDGDQTKAVALGDVDGDGDLDMVCGNGGYPGQQNRLYLNDGKGTFTDVSNSRLPKGSNDTTAVALRDVDGDRDLDLVFGNGWDGGPQNRLHLNDGKGEFTDATGSRMPMDNQHTYTVAVGDVNGDGALDMVFGNNGAGISLYLNDGYGKFSDATGSHLPRADSYTFAVALGDVDADGDLDLVFGNAGSSRRQNRLYLNDGKGNFSDATASHMPTDSDYTFGVALGDVDGDRDLDMVCGNSGRSRLYLNDGKGKFSEATARPLPVVAGSSVMGDVDGDGDLDLVFWNGGQKRLFLNYGIGNFSDATATHLPRVGGASQAACLGDVDGDGDLDLVFGDRWQDQLFLNDGSGKFIDATASRLPKVSVNTKAVGSGDVDGDGDLDLFCGNVSGQDLLYLNDGKGKFTDATASLLPKDTDQTYAVALGDVDGDGDLDVASASVGQNRLYLNLHRHIHAPTLAISGRDYQLDFYAKPGYARATQFAVPFLNLAPAVPAIQRPPFGTIGVSPVGMSMLPQVNVPAPAGKASIKFTIPASPVLVGLTGYVQALMVHGVTPLEAHFTNVVADRIIK